MFSWNIATKPDSERVLFGCMPKLHFCDCGCKGAHTNTAFLKIFAWSMQILASGNYPDSRHDGTAWGKKDKKRSSLTGPMNVRALLVQCRGDWAMYRELFQFPSWSSAAICWKCAANRTDKDFKDFSLTAAWRQHRLQPEVFFHQQSLRSQPRQ